TWVTEAGGADYFAGWPSGQPTLVMDMGADVQINSAAFWNYAVNHGNSTSQFSLLFGTSAEGPLGVGKSIAYQPTFNPAVGGPTVQENLPFTTPVTARYVQMTVTDNFAGSYGGGDRVGFADIQFDVTAVPAVTSTATRLRPTATQNASNPSHLMDGTAGTEWYSVGSGSNYFDTGGTPPVVVIDLGSEQTIGSFDFRNYAGSVGNRLQDFSLRFATEGEGTSNFGSLITYQPSFTVANLPPSNLQTQSLSQAVTARYVEMTLTDNYAEAGPGGDRVGFAEMQFRPFHAPNYEWIVSPVAATSSTAASDYGPGPVSNLIDGNPASIWVTGAEVPDYFAFRHAPILTFDLGNDLAMTGIEFQNYPVEGNGVKDIALAFATAADGPNGFGTSIDFFLTLHPLAEGSLVQMLGFGQTVDARYVQMLVLDNYYGWGLAGGDRVGFAELRFLVVPEPATLTLLGLGGLGLWRRRRRAKGAAIAVLVLFVALFPVAAQASLYSNTVLGDNPVAYWRLGEATGSMTVANETSASHTGSVLNGAALGHTGAIFTDTDTAARFDGTNDKIDVPYAAALNPASFSFECWARITPGSGTGHRSPMTSRDGPTQEGYIFYAQGGSWQYWTGPGWNNIGAPAGSAFEGTWHHLVGTYDSGTNEKKLYVNGQNVATTTTTVNPNDTRPLRIGAGGTDSPGAYWFRGDVDEAAVYDYALDTTQVSAHYAAARPALPPLIFKADFANPGGMGLGYDADRLTFAGRTNASPTPTNPDGTLVLGGNGSGGMVFTQGLDSTLTFHGPVVVETEAYYTNGDAPSSESNAYMGIKALHLMGTSATGAARRGGLFAQFQPLTTGSAYVRLGFQSAATSGNDVWHDHAATQIVSGFADANGPFNMKLAIYGLEDDSALVFTVMQGAWWREIALTIGEYRNNLGDILEVQQAFDLVLSELRLDPTQMNFGLISTDARDDGYNYLNVYGVAPEPTTLALLGLGGLGLWRKRRRS
ncbi:MAG: discoidin domain-containing protein, partial [Candidatus Brocadiae bacterium]|nr:discoidin domain-containing protein [Candidatus Brocadiia bacterium]